MTEVRKLKPIAAAISLLKGSAAEAQAGTAEEIATWQTTLNPLHQQDGMVEIVGVLLGADGRSMGRVSFDLPLHAWPQTAPVGRPKEEEKHMAVFLAWFLFTHRGGGKRGNAYEEVAKFFGYADGKKVERVCRKQAAALNIHWPIPKNFGNHLEINEGPGAPDTGDAVALISKPTWYRHGNGFEAVGIGLAWIEKFGERVASGPLKLTTDQLDESFDFDAWKNKEGPIIISKYRPPPK